MSGRPSDGESTSTRREWLKKSGFSLAGLTGLSQVGVETVSASPDELTKIKYARALRGPDDYITKEVPKAWYDHFQRARQIRHEVGPQLMAKQGVKEISLRPTPEARSRFGGRSGFQIHVGFHPDEFKGTLPDEVEGIKVSSEEVFKGQQFLACDSPYGGDTSSIPGGTACEVEGGSFGSLACTAEVDGNDGYLTAAHLWDVCPSGITGDDAEYDCTDFGEVYQWHDAEDWLFIEHTNTSISLDPTIWDGIMRLESRLTDGSQKAVWVTSFPQTAPRFTTGA